MGSVKGSSLLCVFLVILMVVQSMARRDPSFHPQSKYFRHMNLTGFGVRHIGVASQPEDKLVFKGALIHRDSDASPLSHGNTTYFERLQASIQRSGARRDLLTNYSSLTSQAEFTSPVVITSADGEYVMTLNLGTPAQKFSAIVDTGSDLVWVQCKPCVSCLQQPDPFFDPTLSSTYTAASCSDQQCLNLPTPTCDGTSCHYTYSYGDNSSTDGTLAHDTLTVTDPSGTASQFSSLAFGCGTTQQGSFEGVDGLVGFGQGPLSLPSQVSTSYSDVFSYCLTDVSATQASALTFGAVPAVNGIVYTSILSNVYYPTYYFVPMTGISLNGALLSIPSTTFSTDSSGSGGTFFDSGTTFTYLNINAYSVVSQAVQSAITYPLVDGTQYDVDLCWNHAGVSSPVLPSMTFHFTSVDGASTVDFELPPSNLFLLVESTRSVSCLAMASSQGLSIIGNIQEKDHTMVYDRINMQIGWVTTTC